MTKFQFRIKHDTTYIRLQHYQTGAENPTSGLINKEKNIYYYTHFWFRRYTNPQAFDDDILHLNSFNPLNAELNPICYMLALLGAHHFLHVSRIRVKLLILRLLMSYIYIYIYGASILDVSRSHTTTHHSR